MDVRRPSFVSCLCSIRFIQVASFSVLQPSSPLLFRLFAVTILGFALGGHASIHAADLSDAEAVFRAGDYDAAAQIAQSEVDRGVWNEQWSRLLIQCQMTRGDYAGALGTYEKAIQRYSSSLALRLIGRDIFRFNGMNDRAKQEAALIVQTIQRSPSRYLSRDNMIAAGRYFADRGEDARQVLDLFFDKVRDVDPDYVDAYVATAELAILKGDYRVAAENLATAQKLAPEDANIAYLASVAWQSSDSKRADKELARALQLNPNHVPSLLLKVDEAIDRERYDQARELIEQVKQINPRQWQASCYLAVLAHLDGHYNVEKEMRDQALATWGENPEVDYLIGRKLSDKYRFAEGAEYQRRAIIADSGFHLASFQLAQDLLRLGFDDVGWELAEKVASDDPYNVVAHNLVTLHDSLKRFSVLSRDDIYVRMDPREAEIYGNDVLDLLADAKRVLCEKYEVTTNEPIYVEIFPAQKDFAIRTFGLPGGDGFLGVCFGRVVTANSPASQGARPSNWKSVLWHEFCHVVTLEKTRNRMPRWLSEGISVYEERQRDASWGEKMTPQYRQMILSDELIPVSKLSGAFLSPPSGLHLQFAYYESSLVVEFLIEKYGMKSLRAILDALGEGLPTDAALESVVGPMDKLDVQFVTYAKERAEAFGAFADWSTKTSLAKSSGSMTPEELLGRSRIYPTNYPVLSKLADAQIASGQFAEAKVTLERLVDLGVVSGSRGGVLEQLATVERELGDTAAERRTLEQLIEISSDALPGLERLLDMARHREDWHEVRRLAQLVLAIHPLRPLGHEAIADAGERLGDSDSVARGVRAMLQLEPIDAAGLHFRCAAALAKLERTDEAKHHVLRSLADAPRYREAHALFYQLTHENADEK